MPYAPTTDRQQFNKRFKKPDTRPTASKRGYNATWRRLRQAVLYKHPVCSNHDCNEPATEVHHIIPLAHGGTNTEENLQTLCKSCHSRITNGFHNVHK